MPDKCMISVDEVWLPNPSGLEVAYTVIDKYALRDLDYKLHREIAAKKIKYTLNWNYIPDSAEFAALWDLLAGLPEYVTDTAAPSKRHHAHVRGAILARTWASRCGRIGTLGEGLHVHVAELAGELD